MESSKLAKSNNMIFNLIIIIVALVGAIKIYQNQAKTMESWKARISDEQAKQKIGQNINYLDNRLALIRKQYFHKDKSVFMNNINTTAKELGMQIISFKPAVEQFSPNYIKPEFGFTVFAPNFEALANFVNKLEVNPDFYLIEALDLFYTEEGQNKGLTANFLVSSIAVTE